MARFFLLLLPSFAILQEEGPIVSLPGHCDDYDYWADNGDHDCHWWWRYDYHDNDDDDGDHYHHDNNFHDYDDGEDSHLKGGDIQARLLQSHNGLQYLGFQVNHNHPQLISDGNISYLWLDWPLGQYVCMGQMYNV